MNPPKHRGAAAALPPARSRRRGSGGADPSRIPPRPLAGEGRGEDRDPGRGGGTGAENA